MTYPALEAVGTQRIIDPAKLDRPGVFICYSEATQQGAEAIEAAVRERHAASEVLVAHVIDLHTVPGLFRGVARNIMNTEYEKAVARLPPGETEQDYVIILPDWDATFVTATGLEDVTKRLGAAVFAKDGVLRGLGQGEDAASRTVELLKELG